MLARHFGLGYSPFNSACVKQGMSVQSMLTAAQCVGFQAKAYKATFKELKEVVPLPCVAVWKGRHFVVLLKIDSGRVYVADPIKGFVSYENDDFERDWLLPFFGKGVCVVFAPR